MLDTSLLVNFCHRALVVQLHEYQGTCDYRDSRSVLRLWQDIRTGDGNRLYRTDFAVMTYVRLILRSILRIAQTRILDFLDPCG